MIFKYKRMPEIHYKQEMDFGHFLILFIIFTKMFICQMTECFCENSGVY